MKEKVGGAINLQGHSGQFVLRFREQLVGLKRKVIAKNLELVYVISSRIYVKAMSGYNFRTTL